MKKVKYNTKTNKKVLPCSDTFIKDEKMPKLGDLLITSGSAQIFPPDLLVGKIDKIDQNRFYVLPFVDFNNLDYVQIVKSE